MVISIVGLGFVLVTSACGDALHRVRGTVDRVEPTAEVDDDEAVFDICLVDVVDAGSTYGSRKPSDRTCYDGLIDGVTPVVGQCVFLETEGESSYVTIRPDDACS